jgi:hypothetical protein
MIDSQDDSGLTTSLVAQPLSTVLYEEEYSPPFLPLTLLLMPLFWKYHVLVTEKNLSFGYSYGIVRKSTPRTHVVAAEPFEIKPLRHWGGWGIRLRLGKLQTGYIVQAGIGVKVKLMDPKGKESIYVFSCQKPSKVCDILLGEKSAKPLVVAPDVAFD